MDFTLKRLNTNAFFIIHRRTYTCGRGKENDIICTSLLVSRRHCLFFRDDENLYITDLNSSNGIYINDQKKNTLQMIKLHENDIIGIGCSTELDPSDQALYIYQVCITKPLICDEEEKEEAEEGLSILLNNTVLNNNAMQESRSAVSSVDNVFGKRCILNSSCDMTVPNKKSKVTPNNKYDSGASCSKEINSNLSPGNQNPHSNSNINNVIETIDISADDDIQIIHASIAKEVKKNSVNHDLKSIKYSNCSNKSRIFHERMDVSNIENNSSDVNDRDINKNQTRKTSNSTEPNNALHLTEQPHSIQTDDQLVTHENEQVTDDEAVKSDTTCDKSLNKRKKSKQKPEMRFSIVDSVVDVSENEESDFPYSQLFDIKYEDDTENKIQIKQECTNDINLNTEKIGLLNMDDEVIILTDSEDEDNPWLERLSRSQLLNEDVKPVSYTIIKDEIDLGIDYWDDEISNIIKQNDIPNTSQVPCSKEISPESHASIDVKTRKKKDVCNTNLHTTEEVNMMDVDDLSNEPNTKDIDENQQIVDINTNLLTTKVNAMDVDEVSLSKKLNTKDIDKNQQIDINTNLLATEVNAMDVDEVGPNELMKHINKSKQIVDINIGDKSKQKTDAKRNAEIDKQTIENLKQRLSAKSTSRRMIPVEPLNLPSNKRKTDRSKDKVTSIHKDKVRETSSCETSSQSNVTTKDKISRLKEKKSNFYSKEQKKRYEEKSKSMPNSSSSETKYGPSVSKDEKRKIIEDRKMKLKKIAAEEKKLAAENNQSINRRIAKPRAKVSLKNRGDFLIAEQESRVSKSLPDKFAGLPKSSDDQSKKRSSDMNKANVVRKSVTSETRKSHQIADKSKNTVNNIAMSFEQSLHLNNVSTAPKKSTQGFKATDDNKKELSSNSSKTNIKRKTVIADPTEKKSELRDKSIECGSVSQKENSSSNNLKMSVKFAKSCIKTRFLSTKKRVSFSDKIKINEYEIDSPNTLRKLSGKDAPIPTNKLTRTKAPTIYTDWTPKLEQFLLRIFLWHPMWLEEQRYVKQEPPITFKDELQPMRLSYNSYKQYYEVAQALLLLEMWCIMTKDFEMIEKNKQRPTMMCSINNNSITRTPIPSTSLFLTTLTFEVLVTEDEKNKQTYPIYGDLVLLEYITCLASGKQVSYKIFGYISNMQDTIITESTLYNRGLKKYVKNPYSVITYTLLTRPIEHIPVNKVQRVRTVTYLRSNLRMVQALQYLPQSALLNLIVTPKIEDYQLSPLDKQYNSSSLVTKHDLNPKQLEAVFRVTKTVLNKQAKLCFIQGPPGTGKSKVIVNLVTQILYGNQQEKPSRILICAPSNAAIDELVLRLLDIRTVLKPKRFHMVRIGQSESMHPLAKDISVKELARRHLQKLSKKSLDDNSNITEEIAILKARIYAHEMDLKNTSRNDEAKRAILVNKIFQLSVERELLITGKSINDFSLKEHAKYQRMSEDIIISGANIIACTLSSCYTSQMESIFGRYKERISVCIVDEATQSCEAETLIPLMLGVNTLVLVGDPNQLPATVLNQEAKKLGLDQSIFSRMQNIFQSQPNNPIIMLDTQYRMDYAISYWPNKYFYGGKLKNATEYDMKFPFHPYRVLHHDFIQNNDKFSNTTEAEFVANIIYTMLIFVKWAPTSTDISLGILTPYNNQRTLILNRINARISSVPENIRKKINFEVNTVDGFQGQERDVIIMSCVRSDGIGFMSDKQRLCVALTRAKHSLILCGNFNTFMMLSDQHCADILPTLQFALSELEARILSSLE